MFQLSSSDIPHFLLETGLFSATDLLDRPWMAISANSRNICWKIIDRGGRNFFLKQPGKFLPEYTHTFRNECNFNLAIRSKSSFDGLRPHTPQLVVFHPGMQTLVTELLEPAENLYEFHARAKAFPETLSRQAGMIFGQLHRIPLHAPDIADLKAKLGYERPWIFQAGHLPHQAPNQTKAEAMLYQLVQGNPEYPQLIASAVYEWEISSLIHGDMKWPNLLVDHVGDGNQPVLKIIDWELAGLGDPCWDAAGYFQAYLTFWLAHFKQDQAPGVDLEQLELFRLEHMQAAMRSFWEVYAHTMGWQGEMNLKRLLKTVKYTAVRMIQTCIEGSKHPMLMMLNTARTLQVSLNMLKYPQEAAFEILGIK